MLDTLAGHQKLWDQIADRHHRLEQERLAPPLIRLWDGDYTFRGQVAGERGGDFEFIENEVGTASIQLPLDHYLAQWVMDFKGRDKRNVHMTIDKQGARWSGCMDNYRVVRDTYGDAYLDISFVHDFAQTSTILCWASPFLPAAFQFPKLWIVFGPAKFCLLITLFVNLFRLESSLWTLPDNPLDITEWMGPGFLPRFWRNVVKPFPLLGDNTPITICHSRFKSFYEVAKPILEDAQLTLVCRRYLAGEDPHPFADLAGELNIPVVEDLFSLIPLRHGCLVWDIEDRSGWGTETAFGGSLLTGLIRAVVNIASDGVTEGVDVFTGDATYPGEYYTPFYLGTSPQAPWVVFEEGPYTGIKTSEFKYEEATSTSFVTGGASMPGVNEGISALVNMGGDFLTSLINSALAPAGAVGGAIDFPPLGGLMDAVLAPLYTNVILAFTEIPTLRAIDVGAIPIPGLENFVTGLGEFHRYESWAEGADKAYTLSALMAVRAKMWATRAHTAHKIEISDSAPYLIGEKGFGHFWLGDRVGTSVLGYPDPNTLFVDRVQKISYKWSKDGPSGWMIGIGVKEPEDPVLKAMTMIRDINGAMGQLGIL
jgi:hypothetical protein